MTKIPEDVMKEAYDAHLLAIGRGTAQAVKIITRAIMAERGRCERAKKAYEAEIRRMRKALEHIANDDGKRERGLLSAGDHIAELQEFAAEAISAGKDAK